MGLTCLAKIMILQKSIIAHTQEAKSIAFESEMNISPRKFWGLLWPYYKLLPFAFYTIFAYGF